MTSPQLGRYVSPELQALIAHVSAPLGAIAGLIEAQAAVAVVLVDSPTMLDVEVPPTIEAVPLPDGPLPVRAVVHDETGDPVGEILVWLRSGRLIGIEQAWFTDDVPTRWPAPASVRLS